MAEADRLFGTVKADEMVKRVEDLPVWSRAEVLKRHGESVRDGDERRRRVLLLLEGCIVDVGGYIEDHVSSLKERFGGSCVLTLHLAWWRYPPSESLCRAARLVRLGIGERHFRLVVDHYRLRLRLERVLAYAPPFR